MAFVAYLWRLVRHVHLAALIALETGEACVAMAVHTIGHYFPAYKEPSAIIFVVLLFAMLFTFFIAVLAAAHRTNSEMERVLAEHKLQIAELKAATTAPLEDETFLSARTKFAGLPDAARADLRRIVVERSVPVALLTHHDLLEHHGFARRDPASANYSLNPETADIVRRLVFLDWGSNPANPR